MLLSRAIITGQPNALSMAKSLLENPMIISQTPPWAISLEAESHSKSAQADVSEHPVIVPGTGVKKCMSDNVAPHPKKWYLSGYIPGNDNVEMTNLFTPIVLANCLFLWAAFDLGSRIIFKDTDQQIYTNCVISSLETSYNKECRNKMPFTMTIKQIVTIEDNEAEMTEVEKHSQPSGEVSDMGTTGTEYVSPEDSTLKKWSDKVFAK